MIELIEPLVNENFEEEPNMLMTGKLEKE